MQASLELLLAVETDPELHAGMRDVMIMVSRMCADRARDAARATGKLDLALLCSDWRTGEGLAWEGSYRKVWYNIRERGEAALTQLMAAYVAFPCEQLELLARGITGLDYRRVSSNGIFYLQAAYWRWRRRTSATQPAG